MSEIKRQLVSTIQNLFFDSEQVDADDLKTEQIYVNNNFSSVIHNHFGTGVLLESLSQNILFDSSQSSSYLDGVALIPLAQPRDQSYGNQLEVELINSSVFGRRSVKVSIVGTDFNDELQFDTFFFFRNEKQYTKKHYKQIIKIFINDMFGESDRSLNLGGVLYVREAFSLTVSRDTIMIAQNLQPNLFWRDFFIAGAPTPLTTFLTNSLPGYDVAALGIYTGELQRRQIDESDITTIIGQKFLAKTNNIQKIRLLMSVLQGTAVNLQWSGQLVFSIYELQSTVNCINDIVPNLAIDFDPSNIPLVQLSLDYTSLLDLGYELDTVPQPVDFVLSNTGVANGALIVPGKYYCVTVKRAGAADDCILEFSSGVNLVDDSRLTIFNGSSWTDVSEEDLWFEVYTDAVKVSDGQAYDNGKGVILEKVKKSATTGEMVDFVYNNYSFTRNDDYYAYLQASTEKSYLIENPRSGNQEYSRQQYVPNLSLIKQNDYDKLITTVNPLILAKLSDKNVKKINSVDAVINTSIYGFTFLKNNLYIKIDGNDPRFDVTNNLGALFASGALNKAKIIPNLTKPTAYYRIGEAEIIPLVYGDLDQNGLVEENDYLEATRLLNYNLNIVPSQAEYISITNLFVSESSLSFSLMNGMTTLATGLDGVLVVNPLDGTIASFDSTSINFTSFAPLTGYTIVVTGSGNPGNNGTFKINNIDGLDVLTIEKTYIDEKRLLNIFQTDLDFNYKVESTELSYINDYINKILPLPTSPPQSRVGDNFQVLKLSLEKVTERNDNYFTNTVTRAVDLNPIEDILLNDILILSGTNLEGYVFYDPPSVPVVVPIAMSITKKLSWQDELIGISTNSKSVISAFVENSGYIENTNRLNGFLDDNDLIDLDPKKAFIKYTYPFQYSFYYDKGRNDLYSPNNLVLGKGGQILNENLSHHKIDFEVGQFTLEIPDMTFSSPEEKSINLFTYFIANQNLGYTELGYEAMRFADQSFVELDALAKNQVRILVSLYSYSPLMDGDDGYVLGPITDGKIGVYLDHKTGIVTLNFSHLYKDSTLLTRSTRLFVTVFVKKAGFNNKTKDIPIEVMSNLLGL